MPQLIVGMRRGWPRWHAYPVVIPTVDADDRLAGGFVQSLVEWPAQFGGHGVT
jgi:hypothetical protein